MPTRIAVKPLANFKIWLRYDDGVEGDVDLADLAWRGVFLAWNDPAVFRTVRLGSHGAIEWGPDIDLCPTRCTCALPKVSHMKYKVVLQKSDEGFAVSCPGLPGCWSQGQTEDEALENVRDAIREYLLVRDDLVREGDIREVEVAG